AEQFPDPYINPVQGVKPGLQNAVIRVCHCPFPPCSGFVVKVRSYYSTSRADRPLPTKKKVIFCCRPAKFRVFSGCKKHTAPKAGVVCFCFCFRNQLNLKIFWAMR